MLSGTIYEANGCLSACEGWVLISEDHIYHSRAKRDNTLIVFIGI